MVRLFVRKMKTHIQPQYKSFTSKYELPYYRNLLQVEIYQSSLISVVPVCEVIILSSTISLKVIPPLAECHGFIMNKITEAMHTPIALAAPSSSSRTQPLGAEHGHYDAVLRAYIRLDATQR